MSQDIFVYCASAPNVTDIQATLIAIRSTVRVALEESEDLFALNGLLPFALRQGRTELHGGVDWHCNSIADEQRHELNDAAIDSAAVKHIRQRVSFVCMMGFQDEIGAFGAWSIATAIATCCDGFVHDVSGDDETEYFLPTAAAKLARGKKREVKSAPRLSATFVDKAFRSEAEARRLQGHSNDSIGTQVYSKRVYWDGPAQLRFIARSFHTLKWSGTTDTLEYAALEFLKENLKEYYPNLTDHTAFALAVTTRPPRQFDECSELLLALWRLDQIASARLVVQSMPESVRIEHLIFVARGIGTSMRQYLEFTLKAGAAENLATAQKKMLIEKAEYDCDIRALLVFRFRASIAQ
jgi:hypothetical protein